MALLKAWTRLGLRSISHTFFKSQRFLTTESLETQTVESKEPTETLEQIRARIFGFHIGNGQRSGRKVLKKAWRIEEIAHYYPFPIRDPLLRDLDFERKKQRQANLKRRGKGRPPKGQRKRPAGAKKRKK